MFTGKKAEKGLPMNTSMKCFFVCMLAVLCAAPDLRAADCADNATGMPAYDKQPVSSTSATLISGLVTIIWGDGPPESETNIDPIYYITEESGKTTRLILDKVLAASFGGVLALDRRKVRIQGMTAAASPAVGRRVHSILHVDSIAFESEQQATQANNAEALANGSRPFISIMCKFPDISTEPKDLSYFQEMYGSTYPGLAQYWLEASYDTVNLSDSTSVGWYTLPHPRSYYVYDNSLDMRSVAQDCTEMADAQVDFSRFSGINLMFNSDLDGYAWGGGCYLTLDGVSKAWAMTWEPPWAYSNISVISHEMGHGFGLPHSSGNYGQTYDNQWDVMSDTWSNCNRSSDATYGCLGQDTISYHKDKLGWIPAEQKFTPECDTQTTITLDYLDLQQTNNYKMAHIPINGSSSHFYTVEARRQAGSDYKLPGQGVIIHEVDTTRIRPAYVIDPDLNGDTGDAGAMWTEGEIFSDEAHGVSVSVLSATATGFQVVIHYYPLTLSYLDFLYRESGSNITITGYTGSGGSVVIPSIIDNKTVTRIGDGAFTNTSSISGITIPSSVTSIGAFAFSSCFNMTAALFYGDAPVMKSSVFDNCADGFTVYYHPRVTGFTNPWYGYRTRMLIAAKNCPSENILGADNPYLENLRFFRDNTLALSAAGRRIIQIYYNNAESINAALERSPALKTFTKNMLEVIAPMVGKR
jgi:M6 family metalloprotease-like protein